MRLFRRFCTVLLLLLVGSTVHAEPAGFALALSGGGARGFAHIGVLQALEEEGLIPDMIVGTSIGAIVGGLYCAGYTPDDLRQRAVSTDWGELFFGKPQRRNLVLAQKENSGKALVTLRFRDWTPEVPLAVSTGQDLYNFLFELEQLAPYRAWNSFDDLPVRFRTLATDLVYGKPVVFRDGSLAEAMRATSSYPLFYTPYPLGDRRLVDGGVAENIPVDLANNEGGVVVVAVDLSSGVNPREPIDQPWEIADRVTTILQSERNIESRYAADAVIIPNVGKRSASDFSRIDSVIAAGYAATKAKIPELRSLLAARGITPRARFAPTRAGLSVSKETLAAFQEQYPNRATSPARVIHEGITVFPDSVVRDIPPAEVGRMYRERGYTLARPIELEQSTDNVLYCRWKEGVIEEIRVDGAAEVNPFPIERDFPLRVGEIFQSKRARRGISELQGSERFDLVTLAPEATDRSTKLTIRVVERPTPQLRIGAGYSSDRKGRGFLEFVHDRLEPVGGRVTLYGKYGEMDEELRITRRLDAIMRTPFTAEVNAHWDREEHRAYDADHKPQSFFFFERVGVDAWAGSAFRRWGELSGGLGYTDFRTGGVQTDTRADVSWAGLRTHVDTQDRYPFPTRGVMLRSEYLFSMRTRGDTQFNRLTAKLAGYYPVKERVTLGLRGCYGWNDFQLPLWGQLAFGGEHQVPGLHYGERFGNTMLAIQTEGRYDLLSRLLADAYVSVLYSIGGVSKLSEPFPAAPDYRQSVALRFSLSTFFGPMSITVADLFKSEVEKECGHVYLSLGHEF
ncbi:MAG: patatin-like phospholipase family protein [bacterium]|nr:patatin-like phospholipase family protein [bacterium]